TNETVALGPLFTLGRDESATVDLGGLPGLDEALEFRCLPIGIRIEREELDRRPSFHWEELGGPSERAWRRLVRIAQLAQRALEVSDGGVRFRKRPTSRYAMVAGGVGISCLEEYAFLVPANGEAVFESRALERELESFLGSTIDQHSRTLHPGADLRPRRAT